MCLYEMQSQPRSVMQLSKPKPPSACGCRGRRRAWFTHAHAATHPLELPKEQLSRYICGARWIEVFTLIDTKSRSHSNTMKNCSAGNAPKQATWQLILVMDFCSRLAHHWIRNVKFGADMYCRQPKIGRWKLLCFELWVLWRGWHFDGCFGDLALKFGLPIAISYQEK